MSQKLELIELAEALATNLQLEEIELERLRSITDIDAVSARLVHFIHHFVADADLRTKDIRYARIQHKTLVGLIQQVRVLALNI